MKLPSLLLSQPQRTVGLDLGAYSIKLVACEHTGSRAKVELASLIPIEGDWDDPDRDGFSHGAIKALSKAISKHHLQNVPAVVGIPSHKAALKWLSIPPMPEEDYIQAVKAKLRKAIPYPIDAVYVSSSQESRSSSGEILAVAVERETVSEFALAAMQGGANPVRAEVEAEAIVRILQRLGQAGGEYQANSSYTIVDIGVTTTRMYVVHDDRLRFTRTFKFGASRFVRQIAEQLDVSLLEAAAALENPEAWLAGSGSLYLPWGDQAAVVSVDEELTVLTKEFQRLIRYFRSIFPSRSFSGMLDSFLLCGGLAGLQGLSEFIGNEIRLKVVPLNAFETADLSLDADTYQQVRLAPGVFANALGLALATPILTPVKETQEYAWTRAA